MTIEELIKELEKHDPKTEICRMDTENGIEEICEIKEFHSAVDLFEMVLCIY